MLLAMQRRNFFGSAVIVAILIALLLGAYDIRPGP